MKSGQNCTTLVHKTECKRCDCKTKQQRPRDLTACNHNTEWTATDVPTAAALETQTATQTIIYTATHTQTLAIAHTSYKVGYCPTWNSGSEGAPQPRPPPNYCIKHSRVTPDFNDRSHCIAYYQDRPGDFIDDQQNTLQAEETALHTDDE